MTHTDPTESVASRRWRFAGRLLLGGFLTAAGTSHLTFARRGFQAQVPDTITKALPVSEDFVVLASGVVEIALGSAILFVRGRSPLVGWIASSFFVAVFPGNISQLVNHADSLGLDSDTKRVVRLPGQLLLIGLSLWSTGAWRPGRAHS